MTKFRSKSDSAERRRTFSPALRGFCRAASSKLCFSASGSAHELLILHTDEAQEWASYLQQILHSSQMFPRGSVLRYAVSAADRLHGYNFQGFQRCRCVVPILTAVFLDVLCDRELRAALRRLLSPPHRVVALLCGVSEEEASAETFGDWPAWRKLHPEDEPAVYVSAILDSIADGKQNLFVAF